jgi:hypothetical protein
VKSTRVAKAETAPDVRKKLVVLTVLWFANSFAFLVAALVLHPAFFAGAIVVLVAVGLATMRVRCPRCGEPAIRRRSRAFGVEWFYYGSFGIPRRCATCGLSFMAATTSDHSRMPT